MTKKIELCVRKRSAIAQKDAPLVIPLLMKLRTCKRVVRVARDKTSVLHKYFTWNDKVAGERWRQVEAARLFQSVAIPRVEGKEIAPEDMRFMHSLPALESDVGEDGDEGTRRYYTLSEVTRDPSLSMALISEARRDLVNWKAKYSIYSSLLRSSRFRRAMVEVQDAIDALDK